MEMQKPLQIGTDRTGNSHNYEISLVLSTKGHGQSLSHTSSDT